MDPEQATARQTHAGTERTAAEQVGDFLRHRRSVVSPEDAGVVSHTPRRVAGLRREEVAELAGVSLTYYTRLEQGVARHPSTQVLDAVARALNLSSVERAHLHRLAGTARTVPARRRSVATAMQALLDRMPDVAGIALSPVQDIVAWNRLGHAVTAGHLDPGAPYGPTPPNKVALLFTDPASRALHREWEHEASLAVASLRYVSGTFATDPALARLIGRLSIESPDFAHLWAEQPIELCSTGTKRFHHPVVGRLDLTYEVLHLPQDDGHRLLLMHAVPGSSDDDALRLLAAQTITP